MAILAAAVFLWFDGPAEFTGYQVLLLLLAALAMDRLRPVEAGREEDSPLPFRVRRRKRAHRSAPPQLEKVERLVVFGKTTAFDAEWRLLPFLRTIAAEQLATRHGVGLLDHPDLARELLGERGWDLLNPARELPGDRMAPGLSHEALDTAISAIEEL